MDCMVGEGGTERMGKALICFNLYTFASRED